MQVFSLFLHCGLIIESSSIRGLQYNGFAFAVLKRSGRSCPSGI